MEKDVKSTGMRAVMVRKLQECQLGTEYVVETAADIV